MIFVFFFFKQKTAYDMRISDWSSDVCSSDLCWSSIVTQSQPARLFWQSMVVSISPLAWLQCHHSIRQAPICFSCRSEEHTSELQSLMRISYAVFCLKKKISMRTIYYRSFVLFCFSTYTW